MQHASGTTIDLGGIDVRFLVEAQDSAGVATVFECAVQGGARVPPPHSHDAFDETVYGLGGVTTWTVDGVPTDVGPGRALLIPRGAVHRFENLGDADARALAVVTPGILGPDFFREVAAVLDAAAGGPPDFAALGEVMRRHGLTCAE